MDLLIVGASARAAAHSALRAGLVPGAIDLFADSDLAAVARCRQVPPADYPEGFVGAADGFPPAPVLYTGGLENYPEIIEKLASQRPLWGNDAATLLAVREPVRVAGALRGAGLNAPDVRMNAEGLPTDGSWLRKPLRSSGGGGVTPYRPEKPESHSGAHDRRSSYYQRRIGGLPLSAVFLGHGNGAALAGISLQLVGRPGATFAYRGSLSPWPVTKRVERLIARIGEAVRSTFQLVGLFGVDLILKDETPWAVEVNPRYSASVEVIELSTRRSLIRPHRDACEGRFEGLAQIGDGANACIAKEVLCAPAVCVFDDEVLGAAKPDPARFEIPEVADVPAPGTRIQRGEPVLTVFAQGRTPTETLRALASSRRQWEGRLRPVDRG